MGYDGSLGGGEIEREELVDGDALRGEDAVEAIEGEGSFSVEEIRDVGLSVACNA
jgi:hypothetical protein